DTGRTNELLHLPFRPVVRNEVLRLLGGPERAHVDESPHACPAGSGEQVACPLNHDPLELLRPALADGHEVDDRIGADHGSGEARRIRDIALDELTTPAAELGRFASVAHEAADGQLAAAELVDDVASHEAGAARDQDHPAVSF